MAISASGQQIADLVAQFNNEDSAKRQDARKALAAIGRAAAPAVEAALKNDKVHVRWEAARTLMDIASPDSAPALVQVLGDEESGVRWTAGDALIKLGERGLVETLEGVLAHEPSEPFKEGATRVLKHVSFSAAYDDVVSPVITSLEGPAARAEAPVVAAHALDELRARGVRTY